MIFRAGDGRTAFAKPTRATKRKLVVRVPAAVSRLLKVANSRQRPTRLRLSVLAGKFSKLTPRRLSPVVTGVGDGSGGRAAAAPAANAAVCNDDADHDNDLLTNSLELAIGTDPCLADTDNDADDGRLGVLVGQGPERSRPCPTPASGRTRTRSTRTAANAGASAQPDRLRRRRPDARSRSTAPGATRAALRWATAGGRPRVPARLQRRHEVQPLHTTAPSVPALAHARLRASLHRDRAHSRPPYNLSCDGPWRDDERDADADGLSPTDAGVRPRSRPAELLVGRPSTATERDEGGAVGSRRRSRRRLCGQEFGCTSNERPFADARHGGRSDVDGDDGPRR